MRRIAIASGKGGTGKTTVAVHLAEFLARTATVCLLDLDVEAPDDMGYFPDATPSQAPKDVLIPVPRQSIQPCSACGACASVCRFGALVAIQGIVQINPITCKGCGRCVRACPEGVLVEHPVPAGMVRFFRSGSIDIVQGQMAIGDIRATSVIEQAKKSAQENYPDFVWHIRDCPPGATCPTVRAVHGADLCVLVAEPTAFSLHDVKVAAAMLKDLCIPSALLINKSGSGTADIDAFASAAGIPVLARIPWTRALAEYGARAERCSDNPDMATAMADLALGIDALLRKDKA